MARNENVIAARRKAAQKVNAYMKGKATKAQADAARAGMARPGGAGKPGPVMPVGPWLHPDHKRPIKRQIQTTPAVPTSRQGTTPGRRLPTATPTVPRRRRVPTARPRFR